MLSLLHQVESITEAFNILKKINSSKLTSLNQNGEIGLLPKRKTNLMIINTIRRLKKKSN
jgi:hypothetical protein